MNRWMIGACCAAVFGALLTACEKKEEISKDQDEPKLKESESIVTLTEANLDLVTIKAVPALKGGLGLILKAAGRVSDNLNKTAKVASTLEGRLMKLNFDLNDRVRPGDVLGLVQTPELLGKPLELKAPIEGIITERKSTVGEHVAKETEIYTISDPADLWVIAEIKERDLGAVKVGQDASFTVLAYPDVKFHGQVVRIGNRVEVESRTMEVRIEVNNSEGRLKPGMFADVEIVTMIQQDALLIPDTALQTEGEDQIVFISLGEGRFEKRVAKVGREQGGVVQVFEGVKEGEQVITEGSFILKSEMLKGELGEE